MPLERPASPRAAVGTPGTGEDQAGEKGAGPAAPLVFDVKRYAINDGPGIRLTVFFKGCRLACQWCHNPESMSPALQKTYTSSKCIGCQQCVEACPEHACALTEDGIVTDPARCTVCGECAVACPSGATEMSGRSLGVAELMRRIEREIPFFDQSGGGVTFSGGEPLVHGEFLIELLDACGELEVHRTVDTSGLCDPDLLLRVARRTELFLYDLKLIDSERHRQHTGAGNERILENLQALARTGAEINVRIPLIAGVNDDDDNIERTGAFVAALAGVKKQVNVLPYHDVARSKHHKLGQVYDGRGMAEPDPEAVARVVARLEAHGLPVVVGG